MSLFAVADPDIVVGLSMSFVLALCLAIVLLRDPYSVPPHPIGRTLRFAGKYRSAEVGLIESAVTGMVSRPMDQCYLRDDHGDCDAACCYQPVDQLTSPH